MRIEDLTDQGLKDARMSAVNTRATLNSQIRDAERKMSEAEAHYNGLLKLRGFIDMVDESINGEQQRREAVLNARPVE